MSQSIRLWGATYSGVGGVKLPKSTSGTALFTDTSSDTVAADKMLNGYTAHDSSGTLVTGSVTFATYYVSSSNPSGGNNGDIWLKTV